MKKVILSLFCAISIVNCCPKPVVCPPEPEKVVCAGDGFVETRLDQFSVCCRGQVVNRGQETFLVMICKDGFKQETVAGPTGK